MISDGSVIAVTDGRTATACCSANPREGGSGELAGRYPWRGRSGSFRAENIGMYSAVRYRSLVESGDMT